MTRKDISSLQIIRNNALCFEGVMGAEMDFIDNKCMNNNGGVAKVPRHTESRLAKMISGDGKADDYFLDTHKLDFTELTFKDIEKSQLGKQIINQIKGLEQKLGMTKKQNRNFENV